LNELVIVSDMHTRKKMFYERGDVAIILPGGFGTLDELFEIVTWNQLKLHDKKIYVLNSGGFYDHLKKHIDHVKKEGFLYDDMGDSIIFCNSPEEIFNKIN
ncbi:MAG TPA: LOG family protein, partial [Puia sp.]|nr:LOG family protein [Puia sp.]